MYDSRTEVNEKDLIDYESSIWKMGSGLGVLISITHIVIYKLTNRTVKMSKNKLLG